MEAGTPDASAAPHADAKTRFSARVGHYVRYRPGYPPGVLDVLRREAGLTPAWSVADVGAGTGISAELFLANGNTVHAVEPNADMRAAAEQAHGANARFNAVAGSAEQTGLPGASVDLVYCAQAFHWVDGPAAAREFRRLARPGGHVAVVWNERKRAGSPFLEAYEDLLRTYGTDYLKVSRRITTIDDFARLFGVPFGRFVVPNAQTFDLDGLRGRLQSSSYVPLPGHPNHAPLLAAADSLFHRFAADGHVAFEYETEIFLGRL